MPDPKKVLIDRFPEYQTAIKELGSTHANFNALCHKYGELTDKLGGVDTLSEPAAGAESEELRRRRNAIEEELLAMMSQNMRV